jgi:hypothetical protein
LAGREGRGRREKSWTTDFTDGTDEETRRQITLTTLTGFDCPWRQFGTEGNRQGAARQAATKALRLN